MVEDLEISSNYPFTSSKISKDGTNKIRFSSLKGNTTYDNIKVKLINQDGEKVTVEINEEVNEGVKLIDMNQKEVVFLVEETDSYLIMNFQNEIKETSEY